ncbi:hypothetical protein [Lichenicola sp.]|uniref:hypothetical protein n=1 Tax=Lichenicola sp. TaxID=2804529 RepID=UPI003AFFA875
MPRQVVVKSENFLVGPEALSARPGTAKLMLEIIATWTLIDHYVGMMFCCLLNGEETAAFDIFHSFFDLGPRKRAFLIVANKKLPDKRLIADLTKFLESLRSKSGLRNKVAHGLWGASDEFPHEILLLDGQSFNARFMLKIKKAQTDITLEELHKDKYSHMNAEAFKDQEFFRDIESLAELSHVTLRLAARMIPHVARRTS